MIRLTVPKNSLLKFVECPDSFDFVANSGINTDFLKQGIDFPGVHVLNHIANAAG